jgi:flagellar motor switch protein FliN/FliY
MNGRQFDFRDVPLEVAAELKCFSLTVEQLLDLRPGSIVRSRRAAGDSVDVRVGGQLICQGEVIVIDNTLAVRLSDFDEKS